jgi:hypothetical protein
VLSVLAVSPPAIRKDFFSKEPQAEPETGLPGVFYSLALTFGTLLSSQGTEASFETVSPAPPGFPFVFPSLPDPFGPDSHWRDSYCFSVSAFRLSRSPTLADAFLSDLPFRLRERTPLCGSRSRGLCQRTGAGHPDANRGAPLLAVRQTSTTTGRIIGRRR